MRSATTTGGSTYDQQSGVSISPEEEQAKILEEAKRKVKYEAFQMKKSLDESKVMDAIKHASSMISQLRLGNLTPKNYYDLYICSFDQLRHLESYLWENYGAEGKPREKMVKLYELVQYAGNILPRMYLLITVGSVYIRSQEVAPRDILRDLVEMCRGVQHPTRGLFLRNYLSESIKDKLPDVGSVFNGAGGNIDDAIDFVIQNFTEMNKLWVRMQPKGNVPNRDKREKERQELCLLVGKNLSMLSRLEGIDEKIYCDIVLPRVVEQIINCKDQIAQQYLMECLIQVFPDEFHILTLDTVLHSCTLLQPGVHIKLIITSLIDRLANYATRTPDLIPEGLDIFTTLFTNTIQLVDQREKVSTEDVLTLMVSLLNFSVKCYPTHHEYANQIFQYTSKFLNSLVQKGDNSASAPKARAQIVKLLSIPLHSYNDLLLPLRFEDYSSLMSFLDFSTRKNVALTFVRSAIENETAIEDVESAERVFEFISSLVVDGEDTPPYDPEDALEYSEEQNLVASLIHLIKSDEPDQLFPILATIRGYLLPEGGIRKERIKHTLTPLVFRCFPLVLKIVSSASASASTVNEEDGGEEETVKSEQIELAHRKARKVFKFILDTIGHLDKQQFPELAVKMYLQAAMVADQAALETVVYEFITRAFTTFEEEIADSKQQISLLLLIIGSVEKIKSLEEENYQAIVTKCTQSSVRLLKKADQCRLVLLCSHLFWKDGYQEGESVLKCLQRSLKIAEFACADSSTNIHLFVQILDQYLYYFLQKNENVVVAFLTSMIALINTKMMGISMSELEREESPFNHHFRNTLAYIAFRKKTEPELAPLEVEEFL